MFVICLRKFSLRIRQCWTFFCYLCLSNMWRQNSDDQHDSVLSTTDSNIVFNHHKGGNSGQRSRKKLVLLYGWLHATEVHLEKYRQFWYAQEFDVLTVPSIGTDLIFPKTGAAVNARHVLNFLSQNGSQYHQILVHLLSAGSYQFCEFLALLEQRGPSCDSNNNNLNKHNVRIDGIILDSCGFPEQTAKGLSYVIAEQSILRPLVESVLSAIQTAWLWNGYYDRIVRNLVDNKRNIPGLFLYSLDDEISEHCRNDRLYQCWKSNGIVVRQKCWTSSAHVQHYRNFPEEYQKEVDYFVRKMALTAEINKSQSAAT